MELGLSRLSLAPCAVLCVQSQLICALRPNMGSLDLGFAQGISPGAPVISASFPSLCLLCFLQLAVSHKSHSLCWLCWFWPGTCTLGLLLRPLPPSSRPVFTICILEIHFKYFYNPSYCIFNLVNCTKVGFLQ